ncbi:MAG: radical SAM protein [Myxococcales bacterium]|nr:radical SAM protein [Myxococcales bacterium]
MSANETPSLERRLSDAYSRADVPRRVHLDMTYRCDLDCEHCYLDNKTTWPELTTAAWLGVLDDLHEMGVLYLLWSGGEVFARADFEQLIRRAGELRFLSRVKTHGGNMTPERAQILKESFVQQTDVSVYSLDPEIHDAITRVAGSLENSLAGIDLLLEAGLRVRVSVTAMESNRHELADMSRFFRARGCEFSINPNVMPDSSGTDMLDPLLLQDEGYIDMAREVLRIAERDDALPRPGQISPTGEPCGAGRSSAYIAPDGAVWPCVMFPMSIGQVQEQPFSTLWHESSERAALTEWTNADRQACNSCAGSGACFYCPGEAYKRTGDFRTAPEVFHWRTRLWMQAFEDVGGRTYSEQEWQTVPSGHHPQDQGRKRNFTFPIYQPSKGRRKSPTS